MTKPLARARTIRTHLCVRALRANASSALLARLLDRVVN